VRLATYNLLHAQPVLGVDPGNVPEPTAAGLAAAIEEVDADVLGIQEVDVGQPRSGGVDQVLVAAEASGASHWRFLPTVRGTPGNRGDFVPADHAARQEAATSCPVGPMYGVGLVSRLPVISWHHAIYQAAPMSLPLLVPGDSGPRLLQVPDEPRAVIAAVIQGSRGPVTVAAAHLSFVPGYNIRQLRHIKVWLRQFPRPAVLMGDFNMPGRLPGWCTGWPELLRAASYPSFGPRVQFDHILGAGLSVEQVAAARASAEVLALPVSDHCAVRVTVDL
jgi:endonuclease/exonuclease/phosphatase family metal-dependent hydrolase